MQRIEISLPLTEEKVKDLKAGDSVLITGTIYTARDAAHMRMVKDLKEGRELPIDVEGAIIYYAGPTPTKPGNISGSFGPTTSGRMDDMTEELLKKGLKGMIGKGKRKEFVEKAIEKYKAVYFVAIGGAGALISNAVKSIEVVAYDDLGPESIKKLEVENFPAIVAFDASGNSLYK